MFHVQKHSWANVIEVEEDLDCSSSPALESAIALAEWGDERIIVSLEYCRYCDSSALSVLFKARKCLGSRFVVVVPSTAPTRKIFAITGMSEMLELKEDLLTALNDSGLAS